MAHPERGETRRQVDNRRAMLEPLCIGVRQLPAVQVDYLQFAQHSVKTRTLVFGFGQVPASKTIFLQKKGNLLR